MMNATTLNTDAMTTERPAADATAQGAAQRHVRPLEFVLCVFVVALGLVLGVIVAAFIGLSVGWVSIAC